MKNLTFAIAQVASFPGSTSKNLSIIKGKIKEAKNSGAKLVLFPELCLSGYCSQDLFLNKNFITQNEQALKELQNFEPSICVVVGTITQKENLLFNSALVFYDNKIIAQHDKILLPDYDIFNEKRYFNSGDKLSYFDFNDFQFALTICEDLWDENYQTKTVSKLKECDFVLNLSASPYNIDKYQQRLAVYKKAATTAKSSLISCNLVGSYDAYHGQLVFDGRSVVLDNSGNLIAQAKAFTSDLLIYNTQQNSKLEYQEVEIESVYQALLLGIKDYFAPFPNTKAVIGISGGIDSALVLALAVVALGADKILAYNLATKFNSSEGIEDSRKLCANLNVPLQELKLDDSLENFKSLLGIKEENLAFENLQARIRMLLLMYFANRENAILLNTGNKTELALDNCTIYGDLSGGLAVLGDVDKDLVYKLSEFINRDIEIIPNSIIKRVPSAELKANQKDSDVFGGEPRVMAMLARELIENEVYFPDNLDELQKKSLQKMKKAEWKRRQAPPAIRITNKAFGLGRRIPLVY